MSTNLLVRIRRLERALASVETVCKEENNPLLLMETDAIHRHLATLKIRVEAKQSTKRARAAIENLKKAISKRGK
jgi:hypothetical protein